MSESTPASSVEASDAAEVAKDQSGRRRLLVLGAVFLGVILVVVGYRIHTSGQANTDDAMVDADVVPISAQVGGQIATVAVADNSRVKKGDVLVQIDPVELTAHVAQAEGELAAAKAQADSADAQQQVSAAAAMGGLSSAKAQVSTSRAQVSTADAQVSTAQAQLLRAQSDAKKAESDLARGKSLITASAITQQQLDALESANESAQAAVTVAEANVTAAQDARTVAQSRVAEAGGMLDTNAPIDAKIATAKANADLAHAHVTTAQAALDLARLALSRATIMAPEDGIVSKLSIRAGQILVPGQQVGFLVPDQSYVIANFKETQVGDMKPGQPVDIDVDTYPGRSFEGVVESLSAGTGSRFSVLAPDNASGNFVKVVQRVPVRIAWKGTSADAVLRPGASAVVTVHMD